MALDPDTDELDEIDIDIEVYTQPHDDKIRDIVVETLKSVGKPLRFAELWEALRNKGYFIGDHKLRQVLREMVADGILMEFPDGAVGFPEWSKWYIPRDNVKRVRPISKYRFIKLYGDYASKIRKMGLPVAEALNIIRYESWRARSILKKAREDLNSVTQDNDASLDAKSF